MTMPRGTKAELRRLAAELRLEVGAGNDGVFDPFALAKLYGVTVMEMSTVASEESREYFGAAGYSKFSGAQIPVGPFGSVILVNDMHPMNRVRSTLGHELAHVVREHPHAARLVDENGCRTDNRVHEEEADFLSGELLLPTDVARKLAIRGMSAAAVADMYGISEPMARWRLNISGGHQIRRRASIRHTGSAHRQS